MDIKSGCGYPAASLSNFTPHPFIIDNIECASMEGFLQSLKFKDANMQVEVCKLVGRQAKFKGKPKKWYRDQTLYWQGQSIARDSDEYQNLLDKAFNSLAKNEGFRKALIDTRYAIIKHSIGKSKKNETVLTSSEFCGRLMRMRTQIHEGIL